jgi:predicted DNA-binding transcriptional regulator YafY
MRITSHQTTSQTLTALTRAADHEFPVTITYVKADGTVTVRTIETVSIRTTKAGDIVLRAADRETGELRTFRLDRIQAYTIHRTAYTVVLPEADHPVVAPAPTTVAALIAYEIARDERPVARRLATAA